jgi:DNA-binding transcriptional ArsR family regulator
VPVTDKTAISDRAGMHSDDEADLTDIEHRLVLATRHRTRREILRAIAHHGCCIVGDLCDTLEQHTDHIVYHLQQLDRLKLIEPVGDADGDGRRSLRYEPLAGVMQTLADMQRRGLLPPVDADSGPLDDDALVKALNHPIRRVILHYATAHNELSATQISDEFGLNLGVVSYHVRRLARLGFLQQTRRVPRRGAIETRWSGIPSALAQVERLGENSQARPPLDVLPSAAELGAVLQRRRRTLGYTPATLASTTNIRTERLTALESGQADVHLHVLLRLAGILGLQLTLSATPSARAKRS